MFHVCRQSNDPCLVVRNRWPTGIPLYINRTWYLVNNQSGPCWRPYSISVSDSCKQVDNPHCIYLQVDGTGNCLFSTLKKSMSVRNATSREATYFPNRYFRRMVVSYMANNCQLVLKNKFIALMSTYGIEVEEDQARGWTPPLLFRQYLHLLLRRDFWGDEVVLFVVSCMWSVKITVLNTKTLQEYRIRHDRAMEDADMVVTYNGSNHFNAAGKKVWFSQTIHLTTHSYCLQKYKQGS